MRFLIFILVILLHVESLAQDTISYDIRKKEYCIKYPNNDTLYYIGKEKAFHDNCTYQIAKREGYGYKKTWYSSGVLAQYQTIKRHEFNGLSINYYPNGTISYECFLVDGKAFGQSFRLYENGSLAWTCYMDDGKELGVVLTYNAEGKIITQGFYYYGKPIGVWKYFYNDGTLKKIEIHEGRSCEEVICPCNDFESGANAVPPDYTDKEWKKILLQEPSKEH